MPHFWTFWYFISQPFVLGLLLGLLVAVFVWKNGFSLRRHLSKEIKRLEGEKSDLQNHLQTWIQRRNSNLVSPPFSSSRTA